MQVLQSLYAVQVVLILGAVICQVLAACIPHFVMLSTSDRGCRLRNYSVTFECRVPGGSATVFQGSTFNCDATADEISLLHSRFNTTSGTNGSCNNGVIVARSVSTESNCYTSTLNVTFISPDVIGRMITCLKDDGETSTLIGNISVPSIKAPLSPTNIDWEVSHTEDNTELIFTWNASATDCPSLYYNIFNVNCGSCPTFTQGTNVSCTDIPMDGTVCLFSVQTVVSINITSNWSNALQIKIGSESNVVPFYGLTQVAGCLCPGETVTYQCSVPAGIATVWRGSAFNCPSTSNVVVLYHSQYTSGNSSGECSGHDIRGQGVSAANSTYVSILNVTVNSNNYYSYYQNKMIECVYSDGSQSIPIGRIMINASLPTELVRSPTDVHISDISSMFITFSWSAVVSDCRNIKYNLHAEGCGIICPIATVHTAVSCNNPVIDGRVCHFRAESVICGVTAEDFSNMVTVTLKLPEIVDVNVTPHYSRMNSNAADVLSTLMVEFQHEPDYLPSRLIDRSSFLITYSDSVLPGSSCGGEATIPTSSCDNHLCRHVLQIPSLTCPPSTDVLVTVLARNPLGSGSPLRKIIPGNVTHFVSIRFDPNIVTFVCTFLNEQEPNNNFCSIQYGPGDDCNSLSRSSEANSTNDTVLVSVSIEPVIEPRYCFSATASNATYTVGITGIINLACDPLLLGDNTSLPSNISCDPPYHSLGISNGIACYSETKSGSTAVYFCLNCGFTSIKGYSTRTCLLNGSWTGSIPQCNCNCNHDIVAQNVTDNDTSTCIPNVTSAIVSTNFSDRNPGNVEIVKSPWFFGVTITFGVLLMGFIIGTTVVIGLLVATCISKRQLQLELQQLKETIGPIYEDIDPNTDTNVAYGMTL